MKLKRPSKKKFLIVFISIVLAYFLITTAIKFAFGVYDCDSEWRESSIAYKYTLRGGCLLSRNGAWIPAKNFRVD